MNFSIKQFRFRLATLLGVLALACIVLAFPRMRLSYLCWAMSNNDITSLAEGGVRVQCEGSARTIVDDYGLAARSALKSMLSDPDRFVAAHFALTEITGVKTGGTLTLGPPPNTGTANKLVYHVDAARKLSFNLDDNHHLSEWWITTVGNHTGIQIWDEENEKMVWYNEYRQ